jgi:hypothetical protein
VKPFGRRVVIALSGIMIYLPAPGSTACLNSGSKEPPGIIKDIQDLNYRAS